MKKQVAIDWQKCAVALNLKLNFIGARLKELNRETISADIAYITALLVDEFKLDSDRMFIRPDLVEMQRCLDSVSNLLASYRFLPVTEQSVAILDSQELLSKLAFDFSVLAAFSLEAKND